MVYRNHYPSILGADRQMLAIMIHCFETILAKTELLKMRAETKAIHT